MINVDNLIKEATLSQDKERLACLRLLKNAFLEYKTAKNAKPLDDVAEIQIIRKMVEQREESKALYLQAGRQDLADKEGYEIFILKSFLPPDIKREDLVKSARSIITDKEMRLMGTYIKELKVLYPTAPGKLISEVVKEILNE